MNKPRFKVGDKVCRPEFWGDEVVTIERIELFSPKPSISFAVDKCPYIYNFKETDQNYKYKDGSWDYQLVLAEVYHSPLMKVMNET